MEYPNLKVKSQLQGCHPDLCFLFLFLAFVREYLGTSCIYILFFESSWHWHKLTHTHYFLYVFPRFAGLLFHWLCESNILPAIWFKNPGNVKITWVRFLINVRKSYFCCSAVRPVRSGSLLDWQPWLQMKVLGFGDLAQRCEYLPGKR